MKYAVINSYRLQMILFQAPLYQFWLSVQGDKHILKMGEKIEDFKKHGGHTVPPKKTKK